MTPTSTCPRSALPGPADSDPDLDFDDFADEWLDEEDGDALPESYPDVGAVA